jgi:hypothetical protein
MPDEKPWTTVRREAELDLLREATRNPKSPVRLLTCRGQPMETALIVVVTPYLAYRRSIGWELDNLMSVSRRPVRDEDITTRQNPLVAVELPDGFPDEAPLWHMLTPDVANPAVLGESVCLARGWRCDFTVVDVIERSMVPLLQCQPGAWDAAHPLNPAVADWIAVQKAFELPLAANGQQGASRQPIRRIR